MKHLKFFSGIILLTTLFIIIPAYASKDVKELRDVKGMSKSNKDFSAAPSTARHPRLTTLEYLTKGMSNQQISLKNKIITLKDWKQHFEGEDYSHKYYDLIEILKNENADPDEKKSAEQVKKDIEGLQSLINKPIQALSSLKLPDGKTFAHKWIYALTEQARNEIFNELVSKVISEYEANASKISSDYLKELSNLTTLLKNLVSEEDLSKTNKMIKNIKSIPLVFGPKTEVISEEYEPGKFRLISAEPQKLYYKIVAEETRNTPNETQRWKNINKRFQELRASNASIDAYFTEREKINALRKKRTEARDAAIRKITPQWNIELDTNISLEEKIDILKRWAKISELNPRLFYQNLEKVKHDFSREITVLDEMSESEEQNIQQELETLLGTHIRPLDGIKLLRTETTFATRWINALEQPERDKTIDDLLATVLNQFNTAQKNDLQNAENNMQSMVYALDVLQDLVSKDTQIKALQSLKKFDKSLSEQVDSLIEELDERQDLKY